ncbi:MAG: outer membrane protein assembly factor BamD [Cyclobacteriaceae bacterium]|nr:outer membrane protein assembly factor BamD [Cyclobacteriaceae bacterium]
MRNRVYFTVVFSALILIFSSCKFRKIEKSEDWRVKYEAALSYYEEEEYYKASVLFEQILPIVRGLPEGEDVQFSLAYCNYHQGLYILASHYFKSFYETYGRSSKVLEARYMYAYSLYADSPETHLEQSSTMEAINSMQNFINKYPTNEFRDDADTIIMELQKKLELKGYQNAMQYYKLRMYTAAVLALKNFQYEFPDSKLNEEAGYFRIMAQYQYARQSISSKQVERYSEVRSFYETFIDQYPKSEYIKQAEKAYEEALEKIQVLAKNK